MPKQSIMRHDTAAFDRGEAHENEPPYEPDYVSHEDKLDKEEKESRRYRSVSYAPLHFAQIENAQGNGDVHCQPRLFLQ